MKNKNVIKQYIALLIITAIALGIYIVCYQRTDGQLVPIDTYKPLDHMISMLIENNGEISTNIFSICEYNLQNFIIIILGCAFSKIWTGLKIYYILSFFIISVSVYWCLSKMEISSPVAIGLSVLTTFLPFHINRGGGQIITSTFFLVPLFFTIWHDLIYEKNDYKQINIFYMIVMILAPFIDIRVSWMMIILTIIFLIHRGDMSVTKNMVIYLLPSVILSVLVGVLTGIIGSGSLTEKIDIAKEEGLRLLDMVMPIRYHIVGKLSDLRLEYDIGFSASGESGLNTMGILFSVTFFAGMFSLFFIRKCDERIKWLSWISIIVVFISNIHGINLAFEYFGLNILYWNRMGIFIIMSTVIITGIFADSLKAFICKVIKGNTANVVWYITMLTVFAGAYLELLLRCNMK